jgi:putative membrane protein
MIVFWGIVIALIVWAIKRLSGSSSSTMPTNPPQQTPLDIAKARYARGEISKEQFEQIKKDLS